MGDVLLSVTEPHLLETNRYNSKADNLAWESEEMPPTSNQEETTSTLISAVHEKPPTSPGEFLPTVKEEIHSNIEQNGNHIDAEKLDTVTPEDGEAHSQVSLISSTINSTTEVEPADVRHLSETSRITNDSGNRSDNAKMFVNLSHTEFPATLPVTATLDLDIDGKWVIQSTDAPEAPYNSNAQNIKIDHDGNVSRNLVGHGVNARDLDSESKVYVQNTIPVKVEHSTCEKGDDSAEKLQKLSGIHNDESESSNIGSSSDGESNAGVPANDNIVDKKANAENHNLTGFHSQPIAENGESASVPKLYQPFDFTTNGQEQDVSTGDMALVSNVLEGWHRFDVEEEPLSNGTPTRQLELWEQLLEDGLETKEKEKENLPMTTQVAETLSEEQNVFSFASPGNPFIEGLERMSNFSEKDGLLGFGNSPVSELQQDPHTCALSDSKEQPGGDADTNGEAISGKSCEINGLTQNSRSIELEAESQKTQQNWQTSNGKVEAFEAPSFMSLVDPETHALFEASMPTYNGKNTISGDSGHEKWEANFDLVAPSPQEITRSSSLPRVSSGPVSAGRDFSQLETQNASTAGSNGSSPKSKASVLHSPKLSPIVKKMVEKIRTMPGAGNEVLTTVRQAISPKSVDEGIKQKSLWARCMCC